MKNCDFSESNLHWPKTSKNVWKVDMRKKLLQSLPEVKPVPFIDNLLLFLDPLDIQTFHSSNLLWIAENAIYFQPVFIMCCLEKVAGGNCSWACTVVKGELFLTLLYNTVVKIECVILKSMNLEWWKPIYFVKKSCYRVHTSDRFWT